MISLTSVDCLFRLGFSVFVGWVMSDKGTFLDIFNTLRGFERWKPVSTRSLQRGVSFPLPRKGTETSVLF